MWCFRGKRRSGSLAVVVCDCWRRVFVPGHELFDVGFSLQVAEFDEVAVGFFCG